MAITEGTISVPGLNNAEIKLKTQNNSADGSKNPAHPLLDTTGAIISPATATNQATAIASLAAIQASVAKIPASPASSANQDAANAKLDTLVTNTGGGSVNLTITPTVTAAAYIAGMVVGGKISLEGAARVSGGGGMIQYVSVTKKTALVAPYDVFFFKSDPVNGTYTDNATFSLNPADDPFCVGVAHCEDLVDCGTMKKLQAANIALPFKLAAGTTLYAIMVNRDAETLASTSALILNVGILQD